MHDLPVTVVIPTLNEERNLPKCLEALIDFDDVVILDSGSTDATAKIASDFNRPVIQFKWDGRYPKKRNWYLVNFTPVHPWVLFLDADEFITPEFINELRQQVAKTQHVGFWLNYTNFFLGRKLKHGIPQRKLALFKFNSGLYERIDENSWSKLDMEVHEHPILNGSVGEIREAIDHNDDRGILKFIDRHRDYAIWEAQRTLAINGGSFNQWHSLTQRQRFKYRNIRSWWYPFFYFVYQYVFRLGFLDGSAGLHYAFYKMWYFNTVRVIINSSS